MDIIKFESIMQRYFEKALVALLKKGVAYNNSPDLPTYILIDKKRAVYYLAESDIYNDNTTTADINSILSNISNTSSLNIDLSKAVARLIHSYLNMPVDFEVSEIDISQLNKLSALIISNDNSEEIKLFLSSKGIATQNVEFKGGFLLLFFDEPATKLLINTITKHIDTEETEQIRVITADNITNITDIDNDSTNSINDEIDNLDLSEFNIDDDDSSLKDDEDKNANETDVHSSSQTLDFNNQIEHSNELEPTAVLSADDEDFYQVITDNKEPTPPPEHNISSNETDENTDYDDMIENDKPPVKRKKSKHFFANLLALIFIMPAYLLNKITLGKLPGVVIYWFTMLAIFFGIYEIPVSHFIEAFYAIGNGFVNRNIIQMTDISAIIVSSLSFTQSVEPKTAAELISNPIISSVGFIASVSTFLSEYELSEVIGNLLILKYALTFSVFLMLSPTMRLTGLRLYSSFMLLFLTIPFIIIGQSFLLAMLSENISYLIANPMANPPSGLFMLQSLFAMLTVFVLPIIIFLIYFTFFGLVIRSNNNKGVLP